MLKHKFASRTIVVAACWLASFLASTLPCAPVQAAIVENQAFRLMAEVRDGSVHVELDDKAMAFRVSDGNYFYQARQENSPQTSNILQAPSVTAEGAKLIIRGRLAGLDIVQTYLLPPDKPWMEENIVLRNSGETLIDLIEFELGLPVMIHDAAGKIRPDLAGDRISAVPFRYRAPNQWFDFSIEDIATKRPRNRSSRHHCSEAWVWKHGEHGLAIMSFCQENMLFSAISPVPGKNGPSLRIGGAVMDEGEPAALSRIAPGQSVDLGLTRYQTVGGDYNAASYAYRKMLDEKNCRFPKDYNPPVHWEQLYDMNQAWNDRLHKYTKAILEKEAEKAVQFSCEALYLDPGWDTDFGTFLWGEKWIGPRKAFIDEMRQKYGLKVSLHCPLATWMSDPNASWGRNAYKSWPEASYRKTSSGAALEPVPAVRDHRRNLALRPTAKANASSVYENGGVPIHQIAHLRDGLYGNSASWIAAKPAAWAEIDLGQPSQISEVVLGNDHEQIRMDRAATELRILTATEYNADSKAPTWKTVAEYHGSGLQREEIFTFPPTQARWVRVDIVKVDGTLEPRLDEIEVYEAAPVKEREALAFENSVVRKPHPQPPRTEVVCLGSKSYLDEAEKRLLANCADGVVFLMFDGNWWIGCSDASHGHPMPYRIEDHIRANLELAQRVHAKYPQVLIEMHDMIIGGNNLRKTPIYYKYGLPGSYDENWGFELMWDVLKDVTEGRAVMLYYSDIGCNVPIYLHVNLSQDNEHLLGFWWYASTCRHLGIGGTHHDPKILAAQQTAMKYYHQFERFFKRGEFYGISEQIHLHVLPEENALVLNIFNLSNKPRKVTGSIKLSEMGLDPHLAYVSAEPWATVADGLLTVASEMPAWSAKVTSVTAVIHPAPSKP